VLRRKFMKLFSPPSGPESAGKRTGQLLRCLLGLRCLGIRECLSGCHRAVHGTLRQRCQTLVLRYAIWQIIRLTIAICSTGAAGSTRYVPAAGPKRRRMTDHQRDHRAYGRRSWRAFSCCCPVSAQHLEMSYLSECAFIFYSSECDAPQDSF
jgi:hypothetical protein